MIFSVSDKSVLNFFNNILVDPKGFERLSSQIHFLVPLMRKILTKTKDSHIHDKILG